MCDQWYSDVDIAGLPLPAERFGHSAVNINNTMLVIGGYNGVMYQDVLILTPQNCTMISDMEECVNETFCMWNENECLGISLLADARNVSLDCDFGNYNNFIPILLSSFLFYYPHSDSIIFIPIPLSSFLFTILIHILLFSFIFYYSHSYSIILIPIPLSSFRFHYPHSYLLFSF